MWYMEDMAARSEWTKELVIEALVEIAARGEPVTTTHLQRSNAELLRAIYTRFPGHRVALLEAGLTVPDVSVPGARRVRKEFGISLRRLSRLVGLSSARLGRLERDQVARAEEAQRIAAALGCTLKDLATS